MKKILLFALSALLISGSLSAQSNADARAVADKSSSDAANVKSTADSFNDSTKHWRVTGILTFNTSATALVNWAAGGSNSVTGVAAANISFLYKKGTIAWDSNIDTDYGMSWVDNSKFAWRKTNDKLNISTKFGWEFHKTWYATVLGSFKTQYAYGYNYDESKDLPTLTSKFLTPSYTDLSIGIDWKPNDIFSIYLSPIAGRITTATDSIFRTTYLGDTYFTTYPDRAFKADFGASFKGQISYTRIENLKILSSLTVFTPYTSVDNKPHVELDWDFSISYQFLKVLNVSLGTQLKYYDAVKIACNNTSHGHAAGDAHDHLVQFKALLGMGIGYSF